MIVSGKDLAARLKAEMAAEVATFPEKYGRVPHLVVILVGENPASGGYQEHHPAYARKRYRAGVARCDC